MPNYITLADHEARRLAEEGKLLVVRPVVPQPTHGEPEPTHLSWWSWNDTCAGTTKAALHNTLQAWSPLGAPGDVLVCKEAWRTEDVPEATYSGAAVRYKADDGLHFVEFAEYEEWDRFPRNGKWRPASIMPAWAVRFRPVVREAGAMRVQQMTPEQIGATGVDCAIVVLTGRAYNHWEEEAWRLTKLAKPQSRAVTREAEYGAMWNRRFRQYPWECNPWVWTAWVEEEHPCLT